MQAQQKEDHPPPAEIVKARGRIKWFNAIKGYGFIVPEGLPGDVFIHLSCLKQAGFDYLEEGVSVTCEITRRSKGWQAVKVIAIDTSTAVPSLNCMPSPPKNPVLAVSDTLPAADEGFEPTVVKWFNRIRGYGFLTRGENTPDIFLHIETLRQVGLTNLEPGQPVLARIAAGAKGLQAHEIRLPAG